MRVILILYIILISRHALASNFAEAIRSLEHHDQVRTLQQKAEKLGYESSSKSHWQDPKLKISAKNYPTRSFSGSESPMTGFEVGLSQQIPLTHKTSLESTALKRLQDSVHFKVKDKVEFLQMKAWQLAISWAKKSKEEKILNESFLWLDKQINIAKTLYANGKTSQQDILELQIRKSELTSSIKSLTFEKLQIKEGLSYLFGPEFDIEATKIPWDLLEKTRVGQVQINSLKQSLKLMAEAQSMISQVHRLKKIPDLTIGAAYTFRSQKDSLGDFASISIGLPLPVTAKRSTNFMSKKAEEEAAAANYNDYSASLQMETKNLKIEIRRVKAEQDILTSKTLKFALGARDIIAKSYGLGDSDYLSLIKSELSVQKIKLTQINLWAKYLESRSRLKYLQGEKLW